MEPKEKSYRRRPALAAAAAFGLATAAILAPGAHASTDVDRPEDLSNAYTVGADSVEVAGAIGSEAGDEAVVEAGEQAGVEAGEQGLAEAGDEPVMEIGEEVAGDIVAVPGEAGAAEDTTASGDSDLDERCGDGSTQEQPATTPADTAATATDLNLTSPHCQGTAPGQVDVDPGASGEEQAQLPVGGVDAGVGEATSQHMVLPIATAGAAAAAIGLGAYTLVRRSRREA